MRCYPIQLGFYYIQTTTFNIDDILKQLTVAVNMDGKQDQKNDNTKSTDSVRKTGSGQRIDQPKNKQDKPSTKGGGFVKFKKNELSHIVICKSANAPMAHQYDILFEALVVYTEAAAMKR